MAFKPDPNSYYYLVARHSDKVLEVKDDSKVTDAVIQQGVPGAENRSQQFRIHGGGQDRLYAFGARHSDMFIDVRGISKADRATVMQCAWHAGANQRFRLLDAGDGYYFIEAEHSGKNLDIIGNSKDAGALLLQNQNPYNGTAQSQQFRPVLATDKIDTALLPSFVRPTQIMRDVTLGVLGFIPEAGGAIKFVTGALWPDASLQMFWDQMTRYVDMLIENKLTRERIIKLQETLDGARKNLKAFVKLKNGTERAGQMNSTIVNLNSEDRAFFRKDNPDQTVTYLLTMGTLKLTLMSECAHNYAQIAALATDENKQAHLEALQDDVAEYIKAARRVRGELMEQRLKKISPYEMRQSSGGGYHLWIWDYTVRDSYDNTEQRRRVGPPGRENDAQLKAVGRKLRQSREDLVKVQFGAELDALFAPSLVWHSYIPGNPAPVKRTIRAPIGPFGSDNNTAVDLNNIGAIKGIRVYADTSRVRGLQLLTAAGWGILLGNGTVTCHELVLKTDERIVSVHGNADFNLTALRFETSFGRRFGAGNEISSPRWSADVPSELNARLVRILASPSGDGIEGITVTWDYDLMGDYPSPTRRKRVAAKKSTRAAPKKIAHAVTRKTAGAVPKKTARAVPKKTKMTTAKKSAGAVASKAGAVTAKKSARAAPGKIKPVIAKKASRVAVKKAKRAK
jgi:hypothetical protein